MSVLNNRMRELIFVMFFRFKYFFICIFGPTIIYTGKNI